MTNSSKSKPDLGHSPFAQSSEQKGTVPLAESGLLLVVDAGGTKTAVWLSRTSSNGDHNILGRGRSTAGNPLSVGFAAATRAITDAVAEAHRDARQPIQRVPRAVLSVAGSANPQLREQFVDWARGTGIAERVAVVPDVLPVLAAGTPDCCGVALISGTGSVAYGRSSDRKTALCGGWGFLLGDEGSGYAIGRAGLQFALRDLELKTARQPLAAAVMNAMGVNSILEMTKAVYENSGARTAIAAVAPVVCKAADDGDEHAQAILDHAARDLAQLVARTVQSLELDGQHVSLAIAGGMLVGAKRILERLEIELQNLGLNCTLNVVEDPLEGCVRLANPACAPDLVTWHST